MTKADHNKWASYSMFSSIFMNFYVSKYKWIITKYVMHLEFPNSILLLNQNVSLKPVPSSICEPSLPPSPLFHSITDSGRWFSRDLPSAHPSLPVLQSFRIRCRREDKGPNPLSIPSGFPIQISIFPSFFPRLTSTRSMRCWRNNTDIWSYSICALGLGPKSVVMSSFPSCRAT